MIKKQKNVNKAEQSEFGLFYFKENSVKNLRKKEILTIYKKLTFFIKDLDPEPGGELYVGSGQKSAGSASLWEPPCNGARIIEVRVSWCLALNFSLF